MTVLSTLTKITYSGDGVTTSFTFSFPGGETQAIFAFIIDSQGNVTQQPSLAYTVVMNPPIQPNPTSIGGTVTLQTALPTGQQLLIQRILPEVQGTSIAAQSVVYPPILEQQYDYMTMVDQQLQEQLYRCISVQIGDPNPAALPPALQRANLAAFFDANGNLTAGSPISGGTVVSAAMIPVVTAGTLGQAQINFGMGPYGYSALSGNKLAITGAYTVSNSQKGYTLVLGGSALYSVTFPATGAVDDGFQMLVFNNDSRGKNIIVPGYTTFLLWPGQIMYLSKYSTTWIVQPPERWKPQAGSTIVIYVNPSVGSDSNDGLARGAGAFQTIQAAVNAVQNLTDGAFQIVPEAGYTHSVGAGVIVDGLKFNRSITIIGDGSISPPGIQMLTNTGGVTFTANNGATLSLTNLYCAMATPGASGTGIVSEVGSVVTVNTCSFGGMNGAHLSCITNSTINVSGVCNIYGGATVHAYAAYSGFLNWGPSTVGINSAVNITTFVFGVYNSSIVCPAAITFSNPSFVTGQQYNIDYNTTFVTQGATIPGTIGGVAGTHGGYVV